MMIADTTNSVVSMSRACFMLCPLGSIREPVDVIPRIKLRIVNIIVKIFQKSSDQVKKSF